MGRTAAAATTEENEAIVVGWVDQASAGFLAAEWTTITGFRRLTIHRADGLALDGPEAHDFGDRDRRTTGIVADDIWISARQKLTRRNRQTMRQVRDLVRRTLVCYIAEGSRPEDWASPLVRFESSNHLAR